MLKHGILGLINYHEMTGYEIMQAFRDSLNFFWKAQTSQIYPVLMKVFFMGERSREENIRYFEGMKSYCEIFLESLAAVPGHIETYSSYLDAMDKALYWEMTVDYGRREMQACMEWAQSCIERLRFLLWWRIKTGQAMEATPPDMICPERGQCSFPHADFTRRKEIMTAYTVCLTMIDGTQISIIFSYTTPLFRTMDIPVSQ